MDDADVVQIGLQAMLAATKIAAPILLVTLAVGILIGLVQSVTQIQEPTVTFVPKFVASGLVVLVAGNWMLGELVGFTESMFRMIPGLVGG